MVRRARRVGRRRGRPARRAGWLLVYALGTLLGAAAVVVGVWLALDDRPGWGESEVSTTTTVAIAITTLLTVPAAALFSQWLSERRSRRPHPHGDDVEAARAHLRQAIAEARTGPETSQLAQMVRQTKVLESSAAALETTTPDDGLGQPRIMVGDRVLSLSDIKAEWDRSSHRLVILGEPGYGKTVAALALLRHVNGAVDRPGQPIAELFPLFEWYAWQRGHPGGRLEDWLADHLSATHGVEHDMAAALVGRGLVIPVLDGLDEVPPSHRRRCKDAIDAYAGLSEPFRRFVLTCRTTEYDELGPDWVDAEAQVHLIGLDADEVAGVLARQAARRPAWRRVAERWRDRDPRLVELFASPLRLTTALQVFDGDVDHHSDGLDELTGLAPVEADNLLWDRLLRQTDGYDGATGGQVRGYLQFLAEGMERSGRQALWLHDLHLYPADRREVIGRFTAILGGITAVVTAVAVGAVGSLVLSPLGAVLVSGAAFVAVLAWWTIARDSIEEAQAEPSFVRPALSSEPEPESGTGTGTESGEAAGGPSGRLGGMGPAALLRGSLRPGLVRGFAQGQVLGAVLGLVLTVPLAVAGAYTALWGAGVSGGLSRAFTTGLRTYVVAGLCTGVSFAVVTALGPWLFHHWLRRHLAAEGRLPRRLPEFLEWCTEPQRGWLRGPVGYEFRHRTLRDHLAAEAEAGIGADGQVGHDGGADERAEDGSAADERGDVGDVLLEGAMEVGLAALAVMALLVAAIWVIGGFFALAVPEFRAVHVDGDRPESWWSAEFPGRNGATWDVRVHTWGLPAGGDIRSTYHAGNDGLLVPSSSRVGSLHGYLAVEGCDAVRVTWQITADGDSIARGRLEAYDDVAVPPADKRSALGEVGVPPDRRDPTFVITARRTDGADCAASLHWRDPGFDTPGLGSLR